MLLFVVFFLGYAINSKALTFLTVKTGGDAILGKWTNEDKTRTIEFVKKGTGYDGIVRDADKKEFIGKAILTNFQFNGTHYTGQVYLPKREKSYPCTVTLLGTDKMTLTAKIGFISQTKTWLRLK